MSFWSILDGVVGFVERLVNKPKPAPEDKAVAKKALEKWQRDRPPTGK